LKKKQWENSAVDDETVVEHNNRELGLRTDSFPSNNLICQVYNGNDNGDENMAHYDFFFWYAMVVNGVVSLQDMFTLEQRIFQSIEDYGVGAATQQITRKIREEDHYRTDDTTARKHNSQEMYESWVSLHSHKADLIARRIVSSLPCHVFLLDASPFC